jgi:hypothetical protein
MMQTYKELKKYLREGGRLKMIYHINPKTVLLNTVRKVIKLTSKEWVFEGLPKTGISCSYASPREEDIVFNDTCFSIKIKDKILITYEYAY